MKQIIYINSTWLKVLTDRRQTNRVFNDQKSLTAHLHNCIISTCIEAPDIFFFTSSKFSNRAKPATLSLDDVSLSTDRHQSIVHPFGMRISRYQGKLVMLLIWLTALLPAFPLLGVMAIIPKPTGGVACLEVWPQTTGMPYSKIYLLCTFALTYTIPLPIMILIYIKIGIKLRQAIKEAADRPGFTQAQATKRIIKMLAAVVVCYALCFLPFHTLYFMMDFGGYKST